MSTLFDDLPLPDRPRTPSSMLPTSGNEQTGPTTAATTTATPTTAPKAPTAAQRARARAQSAPPAPDPSPADLLTGLNPQQVQAVEHAGSPLLVVAGAGSGKTRVLAHRIAYLLATGRAKRSQIIAITFTNKAAAEMRERVASLVGDAAHHMWVSTFHSAAVRILRREHQALGMRSSFSIYDAADSQRLLTLVARELNLDSKRFPVKMLSRKISDLKNELIDPDEFASTISESSQDLDEALAAVYRAYDQRLRQANALDFDDLIMRTVNLFQAFPAVAEHYHRRFSHVLVDEYQDTNRAQYVLVRELAGGTVGHDGSAALPTAELTVVGDADQSIYAFRGATIRNIVEFEQDYPNATTVLLEQNYRSTQTILSAANSVIARDPARRPKNLWTDQGDGARIVGYVADTEHQEARFVVEEVDRLRADPDVTTGGPGPGQRGLKYGDVAVFYRTNAQSRALEEMLVRAGVPYIVVGGTRFYERKEIKDAVAYLRGIANPDDDVNIRRILNTPRRGLGDRAEAMLAQHAERHRTAFSDAVADAASDAPEREVLGLATRARNQVKVFHDLMSGLREMVDEDASPADILDAALDRSGYVAELRASEDPQDATRVENLAELHAVAAEFSELNDGATLADFLERVSLVADADQLPGQEDDDGMVTLMTVHTAKGLEFPVVFVTGLEDGTFPHQRSLAESTELNEERRLAYVALTRARERLYISRAGVRTAWGMPQELPASRFVDDIPEELVQWRREHSSNDAYRPSYSGGSRPGRTMDDGARALGSKVTTRRAGSPGGKRPGRGRGDSGQDTPTPSFGSAQPRRDSEVPALEPGDRVTHDSYGLGTVVSMENQGRSPVAKIDFGGGQVKRILLRFAPVTKL